MANILPAEFSIIRGTSETLTANIYNTDGSGLDLTGNSSVSLYVGSSLNTASASLILNKTMTVSNLGGTVTYAFVPSDTASLTPGDYVAEVHVVYGSGAEQRTEQPFTFRILERVKL